MQKWPAYEGSRQAVWYDICRRVCTGERSKWAWRAGDEPVGRLYRYVVCMYDAGSTNTHIKGELQVAAFCMNAQWTAPFLRAAWCSQMALQEEIDETPGA